MKTTRELLELAARAAGYGNLTWAAFSEHPQIVGPNGFLRWWNPLIDDGDSARLEAALGLDVTWDDERGLVCVGGVQGLGAAVELYSDHNGDKQAARRMATLRAAALIGEMK